jgi:transcriptional accessory protein Tex/SPT6
MSESTTNERLDLIDLRPKMKFEGKVTKTELFGAFVDIGAERDGLVHISQISDTHVNRVADVLSEGDTVTVWVQRTDPEQGRLSLTMIEPPERTIGDLKPDQVLTGKVTKLAPYGAFVDIGVERDGLVHISEMAEGHIARPADVAQVGDEVEVRVIKINRQRQRIELSMVGLLGEESGAVEADGEEPALTAMELAWQDAMKREGMSVDVAPTRHGRRRRKSDVRRQQAAIIARTLKSQDN